MLDVVRLTDFALRKPAQLSGGQQQRVALARALVNYPSALLLDEPLGALDLKLRHVMQFELKRIQREVGITFVYVTHDQEEALTMSDRIAVMNAGNVEQIGTPTEIYDRPAQRLRRRLHRPGQPLARPPDRPRQPGLRRGGRAGGHAARPAPATPRSRPAARPPSWCVQNGSASRWSQPTGDIAAVPAKVVDLTFQGPVLRLSLAAADGSPILAHVGPEQDLPMLRPGDEVYVGWSPEASLVLPAADIPTTRRPRGDARRILNPPDTLIAVDPR